MTDWASAQNAPRFVGPKPNPVLKKYQPSGIQNEVTNFQHDARRNKLVYGFTRNRNQRGKR
ncbi:MAG TPA: hypothetical protein DHU63_08950, partial [Candidatus Marinimicrobia bacterium]|nr:hypothetical protein [Candidatus Neomarinimicrobiota bacterium]